MGDMPKPRPRYLQKQITRHGQVTWYVRMGRGPKVRIRGVYGSDEFNANYDAAVTGKQPAKPGEASSGTLSWLLKQYRETKAWGDLSNATRKQRENIFKAVEALSGKHDLKWIDNAAIQAGIERRKDTPAQARHFLDAMRGLFTWAVKAKHVPVDPTIGEKVAKPKTKGFPVWDDEDVAKFEARWPIGTRERVMFDVFRYTGLRRGDAAKLGRQHIKNGVIVLDTEKTGTRVEIPVMDELDATMKAGPIGALAIIATLDGNPLKKESLGNMFADACREAGVRKSAHGLRKLAATNLANAGATVAELEAIFGWEGGRMASLYTRAADRRANAARGMQKLKKGGGAA